MEVDRMIFQEIEKNNRLTVILPSNEETKKYDCGEVVLFQSKIFEGDAQFKQKTIDSITSYKSLTDELKKSGAIFNEDVLLGEVVVMSLCDQ